MALLFCVTFFLFLRFAPRRTAPPLALPTKHDAQRMKERIRIVQQQRQKAAAAAAAAAAAGSGAQADPGKSATGAGEL
jgi:hypothetical protein